MKVGVVTFHSAFNFGATLQTWALQKALRQLGAESCVINYHPKVIDSLYDPYEGKSGFDRTKRYWYLKLTAPERLVRFQRYSAFLKKNLTLAGDYKTYEELEKNPPKLDAYITGSDQVWNSSHIGGYDPAYYLEFAPEGSRKISYGASVGKNYVLPAYKEQIKNALKDYAAVSLREVSTTPAIEKLSKVPVKVVADPTFLLRREDYDEIRVDERRKEKYILVYMMEENQEVKKLANRVSKTLGYPIVQRRPVEKFVNEVESCYTATPGEFIGLVSNAEYVITNSFHGTVFSLIYEKPFISLLHSDTGSRTVDLLRNLRMEDHIVWDEKEFYDMEKFQIRNVEELRARIAKLRKDSRQYLGESLGLLEPDKEKVDCPTGILKEECYGCYACKEICPKDAISMETDEEGFYYPSVDHEKCISCGLCQKVCIRLAEHFPQEILQPKVYGAVNKDMSARIESSSGGVFPELARYIIEEKSGYVVGVRWDEQMRAVADIAHTIEEAMAFRGSKYVKSELKDIWPRIKDLLDRGETVLYSGLPCECAALQSYLRKPYENLYVCEILCHAAPSPKILRKYLDYLENKFKSRIVDVTFRDKSETGWLIHRTQLVVKFENGQVLRVNARKNNYFRAFSNDYISRECCNHCEYVYDHRKGDLTIGDFWGIQYLMPELFDDKGASCVLMHNKKGEELWKAISDKFDVRQSSMQDVFAKNHRCPSPYHSIRDEIFDLMDEKPINSLLREYNDLKN